MQEENYTKLNFAEKLKKFGEITGLNQKQIAPFLRVSEGYLSSCATGSRKPGEGLELALELLIERRLDKVKPERPSLEGTALEAAIRNMVRDELSRDPRASKWFSTWVKIENAILKSEAELPEPFSPSELRG